MKNLRASALLIGTVIGAGVFALPYSVQKAGLVPSFLIFILVTPLIIFLHYLLGDISISTKERHRVPGYVRLALGNKFGNISLILSCLGMIGTLLIYTILGAIFLKNVTGAFIGSDPLVYGVLLFFFCYTLINFGVTAIANTELILSFGLLAAFMVFSLLLVPHFDMSNFSNVEIYSSFLPYGVLIFSFWGTSIIPEVSELLDKKRSSVLRVSLISFLIISIIYLVFSLTVAGALGTSVTSDAITGAERLLGNTAVYLGSIMGLIAVITSFLAIGITLKEIIQFDMKKSVFFANTFLLLPFVFYLTGLTSILPVIGFTGGIFLGLEGLFIIFSHIKLGGKKFPKFLYYIAVLLLVLGMVTSLVFPL